MNRISFRTLRIVSVLSLAFAISFGAFSLPGYAQDAHSKTQLNTLIATARTTSDHQRIADFYKAEAQDYLAKADEHKAMIAAYKEDPSTKHQASALTHCQNFVTSLDELAAKSQEKAKMHEQMAIEAGARH
jgi:hypothetical protein